MEQVVDVRRPNHPLRIRVDRASIIQVVMRRSKSDGMQVVLIIRAVENEEV